MLVKSKKRKRLNIDNKLKLYVAVFVLLLCVAAVSITFFTVCKKKTLLKVYQCVVAYYFHYTIHYS